MKPFIFIHIPKTGGTSISHALRDHPHPIIHRHSSISDFQKRLDISEYYKFSCIRNPWDRIVSWYGFDQREALYRKSFKDFVSFIEREFKAERPGQFQSQLNFLKGKMEMDFIMRYENIQDDFHKVCKEIGIEHKSLPKMNWSDRSHYRVYYDRQTRKIIEDLYREDIVHFEYSF